MKPIHLARIVAATWAIGLGEYALADDHPIPEREVQKILHEQGIEHVWRVDSIDPSGSKAMDEAREASVFVFHNLQETPQIGCKAESNTLQLTLRNGRWIVTRNEKSRMVSLVPCWKVKPEQFAEVFDDVSDSELIRSIADARKAISGTIDQGVVTYQRDDLKSIVLKQDISDLESVSGNVPGRVELTFLSTSLVPEFLGISLTYSTHGLAAVNVSVALGVDPVKKEVSGSTGR